MKTPHTPGPWEPTASVYPIVMAGKVMVCKMDCSINSGNWVQSSETAIANAHLISAAPELLEALERSLEWLESARSDQPEDFDCSALDDVISQARSVISKAKGDA